MACEVCEHCHEPVSCDEDLAVRDGFSYHQRCHKCYVCSETDLHNAEVFKGVIFCSSCSQRIFQGCSTARRTKNTNRRHRDRSHRRRSPRTRERRSHRAGILELAGLATASSSSDDIKEYRQSKTLAMSTELGLQFTKEMFEDKLKISSAEIGMTTEVTQELLKQMDCPVVDERKKTPEKTNKPSSRFAGKKKIPCSDLRIAELGASTEIANMALRNKSEMPVIIKSHTRAMPMSSQSRSLEKETDDSGDRNDAWIDSAYSSLKDSIKTRWMDRRIGSILKLPYNAFKRNILTKSSLISVLMRSENNDCLLHKIRDLFHEDITEHQKQGLRRLYSTINRHNIPHKMGWINVVNSRCSESRAVIRKKFLRKKRCRHFRASDSYRCMRAVVMRSAGPTQSELAVFRGKLKRLIAPSFLRAVVYNKKYAIMTSQACGNSLASSTKK